MNTYEVTYRAAGAKYDSSYIVEGVDSDQARWKADAWVKKEHPVMPKFVSIKVMQEQSA